MQIKSDIVKRAILILIPVLLLLAVFLFIINRPDPVEVFVIKEKPYAEKIVAVGRLKPVQGTTLKAEVNGTVKSFVAREGDALSLGTVIVEIENQVKSEYDYAATEYNRLNSFVATTRSDYDKAKVLYDAGAIPQIELTAKKNALESAISQQKAAKLQVEIAAENALKYRVKVPWDSVLLKAYVATGDYVSIGQPLADLGGSEGFIVVADLDEKYFPAVKEGLPVVISLGDNDAKQIRSEVTLISPQIDTETGTFEVQIKVPEQFPYQAANLTVDLVFLLIEKDHAIVIPEKYFVLDKDSKDSKKGYVLIKDNGKVREQSIIITPGFGSNLLVTDGLTEGDILILPNDGLKVGDTVDKYKEGESQ